MQTQNSYSKTAKLENALPESIEVSWNNKCDII